jgi:GMP synthase (glutamine-hydrolysing)
MNTIQILVIDYGSQYTRLIFHKLIYRFSVDTILIDFETFNSYNIEIIEKEYPDLKAIILSGGPESVTSQNHPTIDFSIINKYHVLGICYGAQLIAHEYGCQFTNIDNESKSEFDKSKSEFDKSKSEFDKSKSEFDKSKSEFGLTEINLTSEISNINCNYPNYFNNIPNNFNVWMSHNDVISNYNNNFLDILAYNNENIPVIWSVKTTDYQKKMIGFQFHIEVEDTEYGNELLYNFLNICNIDTNIQKINLVDNLVNKIRSQINEDNVILALSGGVDSSTLGLLLEKAVGDKMKGIIIDNGLMRKNEIQNIIDSFNNTPLKDKIILVNAGELFIKRLENVSDPEEKRKIIGKTFIDVLDCEARNLEKTGFKVKFLAQGTIYPDIIESGCIKGSKVIKSHHNVGGLPEKLNLKLCEPLKYLFKDDVRNLAEQLKLPHLIKNRHPFPGPGLAIRILDKITSLKINILKEADNILIEELKRSGYYDKVWQAAAILLPIKSVGVSGDIRTYKNVIALRLVNSVNGMTAKVCDIPINILSSIANKITNQIQEVNRVVYDISSKPPATIEWE